jgi:hypothetical protein
MIPKGTSADAQLASSGGPKQVARTLPLSALNVHFMTDSHACNDVGLAETTSVAQF